MAMTTRTKIAGAVLGTVVAGALAFVPLTDDGSAADGGGGSGGSLAAGPAEKEAVPSFTATDWVSYGDQVAVVRVTAEHELREPDEDADTDTAGAGAGEDYLARTVDLQVKERVWARSGAPALPSALSFTADGWQVKDGARKELGSPDSSRLEVGHEYVITLARFSGGVWAPLGSGGVLPYDHGRVGEGEFRGETVTSDAYRSAWEARAVPGDEAPVASRTAGKPSSAVREVLRGARPDATAARYPGLDPVARYRKAAGGGSEPAETFCSVAAPLAVSEDSRYTPQELAAVLGDLAALAGRDAASLRAYAASLTAGDETPAAVDDAARAASVTGIERECGTDVGELLPTDV
ncbi:hypothetical protein Saso_45240 [Streptomyces asoensis]|uniref:Lipoprotein n=2 Tax=Streptomyces asoensis TaxID=249586 RepID=A0ABQ3S434_9ACTN|nr:hypothetical protein GCM10010496_50690 [Streptomyces asoensis]GHI62874.1 hypothetical protein Saso_45240 [Streptomyces asoensis]